MGRQTDGRMNEWKGGRMDGQTEQTDGRTDGRMDGDGQDRRASDGCEGMSEGEKEREGGERTVTRLGFAATNATINLEARPHPHSAQRTFASPS